MMGGDCPFLYELAYKESKRFNIPLTIYTAEDYPLKEYDYINKTIKLSHWSKKHLKILYKKAKEAFEYSNVSYFNSDVLLFPSKIETTSPLFKVNSEISFSPSLL